VQAAVVAEVAVVVVAVEGEVVGEGDVVSTVVILSPALLVLMISEGGADCKIFILNVGRHSMRGFDMYHLYHLRFAYSKY
jgi:hypothetical protein